MGVFVFTPGVLSVAAVGGIGFRPHQAWGESPEGSHTPAVHTARTVQLHSATCVLKVPPTFPCTAEPATKSPKKPP